MNVGNLISGFSAFSKTSLNIREFTVHVLLKPGLENFEHSFTSMWDERNCAVVWAFFGIAFLWDWNENWPFPVLLNWSFSTSALVNCFIGPVHCRIFSSIPHFYPCNANSTSPSSPPTAATGGRGLSWSQAGLCCQGLLCRVWNKCLWGYGWWGPWSCPTIPGDQVGITCRLDTILLYQRSHLQIRILPKNRGMLL